MNSRAPKICSAERCANLVYDGGSRCADHARPAWDGPRTESSRRTGTRHFNQVVRPAILARDGGRCRAMLDGCTRVAVEIHHVTEVVAGGSDELQNLISVCSSCHTKLGAATAKSATRVAHSPTPNRRRRHRGGGTPAPPRVIWVGPRLDP